MFWWLQLETDAVGSTSDSSTRQSEAKSSTSDSKIKQTSNKDGSVEIEHKGSGSESNL